MRIGNRRPGRSGDRGCALVASVAFLLAAGICGCTPSGPAGVPGDVFLLEEGAELERTVGGSTVELRFEIDAGRLLRLDVEQDEVDVVVYLHGPDGSLLFEVDSPTGDHGTESVAVVTTAGGWYRLAAEPFAGGPPGRIVVRVVELRSAADQDRREAAASAALARAERRRLEEEFEAAAEGYREALPHLEELQDPSRTAVARWRLGESLLELGSLRAAGSHLEAAVGEFVVVGDARGQARALNDLGAVERQLGRLGGATEAHVRSLALYRQLEISSGEASALNNLALVAVDRGDLGEAAELLEDALAVWRRLGRRSSEATTLQNLGSLYSFIGRDPEGLDLLTEAVALRREVGSQRRLLSALVALGWARYLAGDAAVALEQYSEAIALADDLEEPQARAGVLDRQGTALRSLGRHEEASRAYRQALEVLGDSGRPGRGAHTLANLGWLQLEQGDLQEAVRSLSRATAVLRETGETDAEAYSLVGLARAEREGGNLDAARVRLFEALKLVEGLRRGVRRGLSRSYFLATRYDVVEELVGVLLELHSRDPGAGHAERALEVVERTRARGLGEELVARDLAGAAGDDDRARRELLAEIKALEARRAALAAEDRRHAGLPALERALRQRWIEMERFASEDEEQGAGGPPALTASEIQHLVDSETVLLVYFLADRESIAWTIDQEKVVVHRLAGRERIEYLAGRLATLLYRSRERALGAQTARASEALAREVLWPVSERLTGKVGVAVMADGALGYLPFGVLPLPSEAVEAAEPLLLRSEVVTVSSATVLAEWRRTAGSRPRPAGTLAVIADPVFQRTDPRFGGRDSQPGDVAADLERSATGFEPGDLSRLRHAAGEAAAILAMASRSQRLSALGFEANRAMVESGSLAGYRLVHFATHALLHPAHPELSGLALSLLDEAGQPQDGFLRAHEIAALRLPADLVVLSACRTGLGERIRGEGLVGLPQAFFRAGARGVVVSHWNVNDRATSELMQRFYRGLLEEGLRPAAALRKSQLSIRAEPRWRAPYYWAGFSLHGDWRQ